MVSGLTYIVQKSLPNVKVFKLYSLDFIPTKESSLEFDLFVFDVYQLKEIKYLSKQLSIFSNYEKVILFMDNLECSLNFTDFIYLNRNCKENEIVKCLHTVFKIEKPKIRYKKVTKSFQFINKFSRRELECANLFMKGYSVSQISKELSLKMNTVSTYKLRLLKKTKTKNLVQLINTLYSLKD
jgi:DNA-binding NarL/FixJ family response regulator